MRITNHDGFRLLKRCDYFDLVFLIADMTVCTRTSPPSITILNHVFVYYHRHKRLIGNIFLSCRTLFLNFAKLSNMPTLSTWKTRSSILLLLILCFLFTPLLFLGNYHYFSWSFSFSASWKYFFKYQEQHYLKKLNLPSYWGCSLLMQKCVLVPYLVFYEHSHYQYVKRRFPYVCGI